MLLHPATCTNLQGSCLLGRSTLPVRALSKFLIRWVRVKLRPWHQAETPPHSAPPHGSTATLCSKFSPVDRTCLGSKSIRFSHSRTTPHLEVIGAGALHEVGPKELPVPSMSVSTHRHSSLFSPLTCLLPGVPGFQGRDNPVMDISCEHMQCGWEQAEVWRPPRQAENGLL